MIGRPKVARGPPKRASEIDGMFDIHAPNNSLLIQPIPVKKRLDYPQSVAYHRQIDKFYERGQSSKAFRTISP